jgi:hypothetical protein
VPGDAGGDEAGGVGGAEDGGGELGGGDWLFCGFGFPSLMKIFTTLPIGASEPAVGPVRATVPAGSVLCTVPETSCGANPAWLRVASAFAGESPVTFGTFCCTPSW